MKIQLNGTEFEKFDQTMERLLRADPQLVKATVEAEKQANAEKRKPKEASASRDSDDQQGA
jgi:hypothetical protein